MVPFSVYRSLYESKTYLYSKLNYIGLNIGEFCADCISIVFWKRVGVISEPGSRQLFLTDNFVFESSCDQSRETWSRGGRMRWIIVQDTLCVKTPLLLLTMEMLTLLIRVASQSNCMTDVADKWKNSWYRDGYIRCGFVISVLVCILLSWILFF